MSTKLTPESKPAIVREEWVKALKSGEYKPGKQSLHPNNGERHCCLGVLELLAVEAGVIPEEKKVNTEELYLSERVAKWAGLFGIEGQKSKLNYNPFLPPSFSVANDMPGDTWPFICDLIENHTEIYFKEL